MSRGKHAVKAANRRMTATQEEVSRLSELLAAERTRARKAEADARRLPSVEKALRVAEAERDQVTSSEVRRLEANVDALRVERDKAEAYARSVRETWRKFVERLTNNDDLPLGFDPAILEWLFAEVVLEEPEPTTVVTGVDAHEKLDGEAIRRIQQARRIRA